MVDELTTVAGGTSAVDEDSTGGERTAEEGAAVAELQRSDLTALESIK